MKVPKWIKRWEQRVRDKFPECEVTLTYLEEYFGFLLEVRYGNINEVFPGRTWFIRSVILQDTNSPSTWQNKKDFKELHDYKIRKALEQR